MATRRVVPVAEFLAALGALECPGAERMVEGLAELLARRPHWAPALAGSQFRVLHIGAYGELPALRLYYRFDERELVLLDIERYDPLLPEGE